MTAKKKAGAPKRALKLDFVGARRVGDKVVVRREVVSRKNGKTVVKFVTSTHKLPKGVPRKPRAGWMDDPTLADRLLKGFTRAVARAKREASG